MQKNPFIAIEGPIGVGKTSLANLIAKNYGFQILNEIVDENPFLSKFYTNIEEWSFQTEMFFLCNRFKQLQDIDKLYISQNKPVVADYHIIKNLIFAKQTLSKNHYEKYTRIFNILTEDIPKPNVIIYIDASLETLLKRIELRGRTFEHHIEKEYLEKLILNYQNEIQLFSSQYKDIPILRLNGDDLDYVNNPDHANYVQNKIDKILSEENPNNECSREIRYS